eukprot:1435545-Amphidinium_carterae.2
MRLACARQPHTHRWGNCPVMLPSSRWRGNHAYLEEIALVLAGPARPRAQIKAAGDPSLRTWFIRVQGDKYRPINDRKRAVLNDAVTLEETIVCQFGEFIANVVRALMRSLL